MNEEGRPAGASRPSCCSPHATSCALTSRRWSARAPSPRFEEALTHPSYANEAGSRDNQRLEFLGEAVLGLCVSEMLSTSHAEADEGQLTRMRSALVNGEALAMWGRRVALGACVQLGKGARLGTEREQTNVLADATEALVAAVYECRGLEGARASSSWRTWWASSTNTSRR